MQKSQQDFKLTTQPTVPDAQQSSYIAANVRYFKIAKAAEILGCSQDDLLHLGANGQAEIMAPVLLSEAFEWPVGSCTVAFPEIDVPFQIRFSAADRVILSKFDLSKIEAVGWANPIAFYAPAKARDLVENASIFSGIDADDLPQEQLQDVNSGDVIEGWRVVRPPPAPISDDASLRLREYGFNSLWYATGSVEHFSDDDTSHIENSAELTPTLSEMTRIEHLFVSKAEVQRLKAGIPQHEIVASRGENLLEADLERTIRHLDRHSSRREPMWKAAVYTLAKMLCLERGSKVAAPELRNQIGIEAMTLWQTGLPPFLLAVGTIEDHLSDALNGRMDKKE